MSKVEDVPYYQKICPTGYSGMGAEAPPEGLTAKAFQQSTNHTERHRGFRPRSGQCTIVGFPNLLAPDACQLVVEDGSKRKP